jgi:enoyl-CoA hydratase
VLAARDQGVAAADALTPALTGAVFETDDLAAGVASLLQHGPGKAVYIGR